MQKYIVYFAVTLLAAGLVFASGMIKQNPEFIAGFRASDDCTAETLSCKIMASVYKDAVDITHGLNRQGVDKADLPIVRIYMDEGAIAKLDAKRKSVLDKTRPIHISESEDWVKATVLVDSGEAEERSKVSLRLKGDWGDHMNHPSKLSFRIKTRSGGYLLGLKTFSIQHPKARAFEREPMLQNHMRQHGIVAPRYRFVDVRINDYPIGVMALEEHFRKEMLEAQNRRDGPILAFDEDTMWAQWDINYNGANPISNGLKSFSPSRDTPIKDFREARFRRGTIPTNNALRGHALMRDFFRGKIAAREALDFDKFSKYWVLMNVWGGCHAAVWHNRRYYYNPISGLLEPISYDNVPSLRGRALRTELRYCAPADVKAALQDPLFREKVVDFAAQLSAEFQSEEFKASLVQQQAHYDGLLGLEDLGQWPAVYTPELLTERLLLFLRRVNEDQNFLTKTGAAKRPNPENFVASSFFKTQDQYATHMSAFYIPSGIDKGRLVMRNLTPHPLEVRDLYFRGKRKRKASVPFEVVSFPSVLESISANSQDIEIADELIAGKDTLTIEYLYRGEVFEHTVSLQFENYDSGFSDTPIRALQAVLGNGQVNHQTKEIMVRAGTYDFRESISLPYGWRTTIMPGAVLNFHNGSLFKLQGRLMIQGTADNPVIMNVNTNLTFRDIGAWGGLLVSKSPERSSVKHLVLNGTGEDNLANRQGFYGMTGCLSFFESDVTITDSEFHDAQCEDALNIVKSDFILDGIVISKARADAFDSDFSTGLIKRSKFLNIGNDGIDVSGTKLELDRVTAEGIGDKAVSVGEKSELYASGVDVDGAVLGIASKDLSDALVENSTFDHISGTALITYIKKAEYGASSIECRACRFGEAAAITGRQDGTRIIVNGSEDRRGYLSEQQVSDAGLAEAG